MILIEMFDNGELRPGHSDLLEVLAGDLYHSLITGVFAGWEAQHSMEYGLLFFRRKLMLPFEVGRHQPMIMTPDPFDIQDPGFFSIRFFLLQFLENVAAGLPECLSGNEYFTDHGRVA